MKKYIVLAVSLFSSTLFAQDLSFSKPLKNVYRELPNPAVTPVEQWSKVTGEINVSFADDNFRYPKEQVPVVSSDSWTKKAWKGEKVHTQILVWAKISIPEVTVTAGDLVSESGNHIDARFIKTGFVRYVMTDEFGEGCDERTPAKYDSSLVEDPIDIIYRVRVEANSVQPVWISISVPGNIPSGNYKGSIRIKAGREFDLSVTIKVDEHVLPHPSEWKFDLDLWQSPGPVAEVHDVELWSNEHFELMKPYFSLLASAGQKVISANIINQPWGREHTYYEEVSLIKWTKRKDGTWFYDYNIFDRYINMMMDCGITKRINCYSMVTWNLFFPYFDESMGETKSVKLNPGSQEYKDFWTPMLKDFTAHLKEKGWFEKTAVAMDERPMESMLAVFALLKEIDPEWKTALAGTYHPEIARDIYDYSLNYVDPYFEPDVLKERKEAGKPSTYYTACQPPHPNCFTFSPLAEAVWIGWYAMAKGYTGYLRWAYNNWSESTLTDTRFRTWPAADCYFIYPGPRSSIRFEKLIEGIQDFEKIWILKEQFLSEGNLEKLNQLDQVLSIFNKENLEKLPAIDMLKTGKEFLDAN
jgi:hypothetical protein